MKPKIELVTLDKLQTNERNPRYLRESSFLKLRASLEKRPNLLLLNPIKAKPDGTIIAGNQRYRAALDLGWKEIPVIYSELSEEENNEFMLLDNAHYGEWDTDTLANEWDAELLEEFNIPFFFPEEPEEDEDEPLKLEKEVCELCGK